MILGIFYTFCLFFIPGILGFYIAKILVKFGK